VLAGMAPDDGTAQCDAGLYRARRHVVDTGLPADPARECDEAPHAAHHIHQQPAPTRHPLGLPQHARPFGLGAEQLLAVHGLVAARTAAGDHEPARQYKNSGCVRLVADGARDGGSSLSAHEGLLASHRVFPLAGHKASLKPSAQATGAHRRGASGFGVWPYCAAGRRQPRMWACRPAHTRSRPSLTGPHCCSRRQPSRPMSHAPRP